MRRFLATVLFASGCLSTPDPAPSPSTCAEGFGGDGNVGTRVAGTGRLILDTNGTAGTYESPIADAGEARAWSLSWTTAVPSLKQLPGDGASDIDYPRGVDMAGNVLLYHLDEPNGSLAFADASGSDLPAMCGDPCATAGADGLFGEGATTGTNARLLRPTDSRLEAAEISIEVWALRLGTHGGNAGALVTLGHNGGTEPFSSYSVEQADVGAQQPLRALRCYFGSAGDGVTVSSLMAVPEEQVFHVVCTHDGTDARIFLNGVEGSTAMAPPIEYAEQLNHDLTIGTYGVSSQDFNGLVDEVAIYDRALSPDEVEDRWDRGAHRVELQVRSCDDPTCSDQDFVGPDGTANTRYSERCNLELGPPRDLPTRDVDCDGDGDEDDGADQAVPSRQYAQYRLHLGAVGDETPEILDAALCPVTP